MCPCAGGIPGSLTIRTIQHSWPNRTHQLDPPNRATEIERTFGFDEGRRLAAENPDVDIGGLLSYDRRNHTGDTPNLHLQHIMHCFSFGPTNRERLLALRIDR